MSVDDAIWAVSIGTYCVIRQSTEQYAHATAQNFAPDSVESLSIKRTACITALLLPDALGLPHFVTLANLLAKATNYTT